jgi:hypothetical protein
LEVYVVYVHALIFTLNYLHVLNDADFRDTDDVSDDHDYDIKNNGTDRFATVMFYLTDVAQGGCTGNACMHTVTILLLLLCTL